MDFPLEVFEVNIIMSATFPIFVGRGKIVKNNSCKDIVVLGPVRSTVHLGRMTQVMANFTVFPTVIVSQLVGHLLGDGALTMSTTSNFPYFVFTQTIKRFEYIWVVFVQLSHYCNSFPLLDYVAGYFTPLFKY